MPTVKNTTFTFDLTQIHVVCSSFPMQSFFLFKTARTSNTQGLGANSLASIFLSRRVKLIVTSERLNIFKKCFHQSKVK